MSTTVGELLDLLAIHLMETDRTFSTGLWTQTELIGYIWDVERDFLMKTGVVKKINQVTGVTSQIVYDEPADSIDVERISWNGKRTFPTTQFDLDSQNYKWRADTARNPRRFHRDNLPRKQFGVWPAPNTSGTGVTITGTYGIPRIISGSQTYSVSGTYGVIRQISGSVDYLIGRTYTPPSTGYYGTFRVWRTGSTNFILIHDVLPAVLVTPDDPITTPDAFSRYILYGVLNKAWLKEGDGQDTRRATYCKIRYDRGVWLAKRLIFGDKLEQMP